MAQMVNKSYQYEVKRRAIIMLKYLRESVKDHDSVKNHTDLNISISHV